MDPLEGDQGGDLVGLEVERVELPLLLQWLEVEEVDEVNFLT